MTPTKLTVCQRVRRGCAKITPFRIMYFYWIYAIKSERARSILSVQGMLMKNQKTIKAIIIILAVLCAGLFSLYAVTSLSPDDDTDSGNLSGYGSDNTQNGYFDDNVVANGNDGSYTITDDNTVEMDSIPNDAVSGSDVDWVRRCSAGSSSPVWSRSKVGFITISFCLAPSFWRVPFYLIVMRFYYGFLHLKRVNFETVPDLTSLFSALCTVITGFIY